MSRFTATKAKHYRCRNIGGGHYRLSWTMDYYYPDSLQRHPRVFHRITDRKGAERFCRKWGCMIMEPPQ